MEAKVLTIFSNNSLANLVKSDKINEIIATKLKEIKVNVTYQLLTNYSNKILTSFLAPNSVNFNKPKLKIILGSNKTIQSLVNYFANKSNLNKINTFVSSGHHITGYFFSSSNKEVVRETENYLLLIENSLNFDLKELDSIISYLGTYFANDQVIKTKTLCFFGINEKELQQSLNNLALISNANTSFVTLTKNFEVKVNITVNGNSNQQVDNYLSKIITEIITKNKAYFFGFGANTTLEEVVVNLLINSHTSITAAESLTAGLFQATLANVPGVSKVFPGGIVTYADEVKISLLNIPSKIITKYGVVSQPTAEWMARQVKTKLHTDIGISFTGVAGPEKVDNHAVGDVWIGIASSLTKEPVLTKNVKFNGSRNEVRQYMVKKGLMMLYHLLS